MRGNLEKLRKSWMLLHQDIFVGEMREQNMRACLLVGISVAIAAGITTTLNFLGNRDFWTIVTTISQVIGGIIIVVFILHDNKKIPTISMMLICIITFTYYAFSGATGGTTIIWTLLAPLGIGYFGNALYGIYCGIYFEVLLIFTFYTPVRNLVSVHYNKFFMDRFPVLYLLNLMLVSICLINYHVSVLKLTESARQLLKSKEEADRANRGKSDFLSNMSHEIRTPINAVLGMNEMILRESMSAKDRTPQDIEITKRIFEDISKYAGNIESAGNNLLYLINDILDFSKIESGRMQLVETDYKLSSLLNDVSNMIFFRAKEKGLDFEVDVDGSIPDGLHGDEVRIRQIIINLLNNAVKYTKTGYVHLKVYGEDIGEETSKRAINLTVSVTDTGIGIKEEDIPKLFTKFERLDLEQNSTVEGTGLGLAITKNLLEMMGGDILVTSVYNGGSTFTVHLPQIVTSEEALGDFRKRFDESLQTMEVYVESFHAPDAHILVVDDTRMNLVVVEGLLNHTGIKMDMASSGAEAIELARKNKYDIILMDQRMPGMNGTEAMQHIKENNGINIDTPFICLTADAISGAKERYIRSGFADYLTKPIDYKALESMIIAYLPEEKAQVNLTSSKQQKADDSQEEELEGRIELLKNEGIDTDTGVKYCNNDSGFYIAILQEYVSGSKERKDTLNECIKTGDISLYETTVHALKSSSKMIGANDLSEKAADMERAAHETNRDYLEKHHDDLMEMYDKVLSSIRTVFPDFKENTESAEEILEFMPQGE